jgi:hypothetical protein
VEGIGIERKRAYKLNEKSAKTIAIILNTHDKIKGFTATILKAQTPQ